MFEKVNPSHPDKIADRIAGAIVDYAYKLSNNPKIAVEVLIGHGECHIIAESNLYLGYDDIYPIVERIAGNKILIDFLNVSQDINLAKNQKEKIRCGDNGIFRGVPFSREQILLNSLAYQIYKKYKSDGKYILDEKNGKFIICQSNANAQDIRKSYPNAIINPLGDWTGGTNVDTGATNRKLGSDMGDAMTGGGLHGKDLSKADVSVNIYAFLQAQKLGRVVEYDCAIGDDIVDDRPYSEIVEIARKYIKDIGGFEKFAEWGFI